jgi:hypothetical protein
MYQSGEQRQFAKSFFKYCINNTLNKRKLIKENDIFSGYNNDENELLEASPDYFAISQ